MKDVDENELTSSGRANDRDVIGRITEPADRAVRYDLQILRALRQIIHAVDVYSRKLKTRYHITAPQLVCLTTICQNGSMTTTHIAGQVHLSPSTVVGILDRLERQGWIQRVRDSRDRRVVNVTVTEEGRRLVDNAPSLLQDRLADALQRLPDLEQATIALSVRRIADLMDVPPQDAPPYLEADGLDSTGMDEPG